MNIPDFGNLDHVGQWVDGHSVADLRTGLTAGFVQPTSRHLVTAWLERHDRAQAERERNESLQALKRATEAAERSARWTFWAALAAALAAVAGAVQAYAAFIAK
jgi:hypothetical protein